MTQEDEMNSTINAMIAQERQQRLVEDAARFRRTRKARPLAAPRPRRIRTRIKKLALA
jgi:hypothetical protein